MSSVQITDEELVARFAGHSLSYDNRAHFLGRLRHELVINRCDDCGRWHSPSSPVCPHCWSSQITPTPVSGRGVIHLVVFLHQGPPADGVDYTSPYPVATVELDEQPGLRFTSTVVDASNDAITIGRRVELHWIERGTTPVPVFRLSTGADQ